MFTVDTYLPTRIILGAGRLDELKDMKLPGKKALICTTSGKSVKASGLLERVEGLLEAAGAEHALYDRFTPNPTKSCVEGGVKMAQEEGCDFVVGLGGGSSIDGAKAIAIMMKSPGDLWDYGYTGTGGQKEVPEAAPVVAITTTCGTGTEADQYSVITNEDTLEKLDFTCDAIFPAISVIDPELFRSLPRDLTIYQGFDALFHAAECYVTNRHENRMVDLYAKESVKTVNENLVKVVENGDDLEARCNMAFAADILSGYCMTMVSTTSHHILAQTLGGMYPSFPHGACLISVCESYYTHACRLEPELFDELGEIMGVARDPEKPGYAFVQALIDLMEKTGARYLKMSDYGVKEEDFKAITDMTTHQVGIAWEHYKLTDDDFMEILADSYR